LVPAVSVANGIAVQPSNTWSAFALVVQRASETLHPPQLHLYRSASGIHVSYIVQKQHVLFAQFIISTIV